MLVWRNVGPLSLYWENCSGLPYLFSVHSMPPHFPRSFFIMHYFHLFTLCLYIFSVDKIKMTLSSPPLSGTLLHDSLPNELVLSQDSVFIHPYTSLLSDTSLSFMALRKSYLLHSFTHHPCAIFKFFLCVFWAWGIVRCSYVTELGIRGLQFKTLHQFSHP